MEGREFKTAIFEQFARTGAAFSSAKRIEILDLLAQGDRSVDSIARATGLGVANASRHLQVLRNAGLLASRREGVHVVYRVADQSVVDGYLALRRLAESRISDIDRLASAFFSEVDGVEPVGFDELRRRHDAGEVVIVDVRPELEFEAGHVPGAVSMPLRDLSERMAELPSGVAVVAYCRGPYCVLAAQAVSELRAGGRRAVRLDGGVPEWKSAGHPVQVGSSATAGNSQTKPTTRKR